MNRYLRWGLVTIAVTAVLAWSGIAQALTVDYALPKCDLEAIFIGDGSTCVTVSIKNVSSNPTSVQNYQATYQNGTKASDNDNGPNQGAVFSCNLIMITAHELVASSGTVQVTT